MADVAGGGQAGAQSTANAEMVLLMLGRVKSDSSGAIVAVNDVEVMHYCTVLEGERPASNRLLATLITGYPWTDLL